MSRILIAEDEQRIASFLEKGLRANGFVDDHRRATGRAALALALTASFDLVVLDLGLPGMDGLDVLRALRAARAPVPVVILTARDGVDAKVAGARGLGADDYVTKPFRFEELLARVRARLRADRAPRADGAARRAVALDLRTRRATSGARGRADRRASSRCRRRSSATPTRCSRASSCSPASGATTSTPAPTSSTSTSATCAASSARSPSRRSAAWATGSSSRQHGEASCGVGLRGLQAMNRTRISDPPSSPPPPSARAPSPSAGASGASTPGTGSALRALFLPPKGLPASSASAASGNSTSRRAPS